jgi:hypothetical protein
MTIMPGKERLDSSHGKRSKLRIAQNGVEPSWILRLCKEGITVSPTRVSVAAAFVVIAGFLILLPPIFGQVDTAWVREYNGSGNGEDRAVAMVLDGSGNIYVTGESVGSGTYYDYATIKYLPTGDTVWVRRYNGTASGMDKATAVAVDRSGNVYVTGLSQGTGTSLDYLTIGYDPDGIQLWAKRYDGPAGTEDKAYAIAVDDSGNVYVTGTSAGSGTSDDYATVRYYPGGDTAWIRRYNGSGNGPDQACAIAVDDSQNVYVTGYSWGGLSNLDYATVKYDRSGNEVWVRRYDGAANGEDRAAALAVDDWGDVYVTGYSTGAGTLRDYLTVKYLSNGDTVWIARYDGPANDRDEANAIAADHSGNVCVTGFSWDSGTNLDYATVKYLPNGDIDWVGRYDGPDNAGDYAEAIAVDLSGNVYVTGGSDGGGTGQDCATIKYLPNGDTAWIKRYDGEAGDDDQACAIATDGFGNVYVTGFASGIGTSTDYVTIRYSPTQEIPSLSRYPLLALIALLMGTAVWMIATRRSAVHENK